MPIAKMKRLQVLALERDHDALLRQLERMGCVEISEPDAPDAPESLRRCDSETADCLARQRQVQTAIDALRRAAPPKKAPLLAPRPAIGETEYLSETGKSFPHSFLMALTISAAKRYLFSREPPYSSVLLFT